MVTSSAPAWRLRRTAAAVSVFALFASIACRSAATERDAAVADALPTAPTEQHLWLQRLIGDWDFTVDTMMPGASESLRIQGRESVRPIGGMWVVGVGRAETPEGPFESVLTLGFEPDRDRFVGTWIDSLQSNLVRYEGRRDPTNRVLHLDAMRSEQRPSPLVHRDTLEFFSPDHRRLTSSVRRDDGTWFVYLSVDYRRRS